MHLDRQIVWDDELKLALIYRYDPADPRATVRGRGSFAVRVAQTRFATRAISSGTVIARTFWDSWYDVVAPVIASLVNALRNP